MKTLLALAALAGCAFLPCVRAHDCPDTCATPVQASVGGGRSDNQCFIGITLFGLEIGVTTGNCPLHQFVYPAHQICMGQASEGTQCEPGDSLEVRMLRCSCNMLGGSFLGIGLPGCDCDDAGNAGSVQDAKTVACE